MSYVYHIVKFKDGSAYLMFDVCSWNCLYCVRNLNMWCSSLSAHVQAGLKTKGIKYIGIEETVKILKENSVSLVFLGGGEPTQDPMLSDLMRSLKKENIESWLITNGELLSDELFELAKGITFSIKALDRAKHIRLTGMDNQKVVENFKRYGKPEKVVAETVYFPALIDCNEVVEIAKFIESVDSRIRFRIDPAVQLKDLSAFRECVKNVKMVHEKTYYIKFREKTEAPELLYPLV
ncbi:MAG: radical SAM protein [Nitrososphaeria archaeon]|nr:radical SAM protein [Conexivisphaerales archaeon]